MSNTRFASPRLMRIVFTKPFEVSDSNSDKTMACESVIFLQDTLRTHGPRILSSIWKYDNEIGADDAMNSTSRTRNKSKRCPLGFWSCLKFLVARVVDSAKSSVKDDYATQCCVLFVNCARMNAVLRKDTLGQTIVGRMLNPYDSSDRVGFTEIIQTVSDLYEYGDMECRSSAIKLLCLVSVLRILV